MITAPTTFAELQLPAITPSLTNPRKTFHSGRLAELAASIAASGVHQPILVRPLPASRLEDTAHLTPRPEYELVAGERRYRASLQAKRPTIPAMVRELTDDQVLEIQIVENLQRDDIAALEEAEGYERLMHHSSITADQVGEKIGKSRSYVYGRLKLLALSQTARQALRDGKIDVSKALLVARIPDEKLQGEALKEITRTDWEGEAMSAREAARHVQDHYMLQLKQAVFAIADESLLPAAGACTACPKRTGANPDLFQDVKSADVCTDPSCYRKKEEAHAALQVEKAREKGQTVIAGKEAQELVTGGYSNTKYKGYKRLDSAEDSPTDQPLRKIIGAQMKADGIEAIMIEHHKKPGELVAALPNEVVLSLLKKVDSQAQAAKTVSKEIREFADEKKAKAEARAKTQYEQSWRNQLLARAWDEISNGDVQAYTTEVHRFMAQQEITRLSTDQAQDVCKTLGLGAVGSYAALHDHLKETAHPEQFRLLMLMRRDSHAGDYTHTNGERVNNAGLMLVAGIVFGDGLPTEITAVQSRAMAEYFPEVKRAKADLPLSPAAQAEGGGGEPKPKKEAKKPRPAAPAAKAKASKEETALGIAAALQGLEAAAPAAEGANTGADAQGIEASAPADARTSERPAQDTPPAAIESGQRVRVLVTVRGPNAKYVGKEGLVRQRSGVEWMVMFTGKSGKVGAMASFLPEELEVVE